MGSGPVQLEGNVSGRRQRREVVDFLGGYEGRR